MENTNLKKVLDHYDAFLIDQFGVLIDDSGPYEGAVAALNSLFTSSKYPLVLTNSGKRTSFNVDRLKRMGFVVSVNDVLSSGEVARNILNERTKDQVGKRTKVWVHAHSYLDWPLEGLNVESAKTIEDADIIVLVATRNESMTLLDYQKLLGTSATRKVPCLCINPDEKKLINGEIGFSAGAVAQLYKKMGGPVEWIGKPYPTIYEYALQRLTHVPKNRILCIGDSLFHDVKGGCILGIDTALVRTGILSQLTDAELLENCRQSELMPNYILPSFSL